MARSTTEQRLEAEREKLERQKLKVARLQARLREKQRKEDTRRKVLLGTWLLEEIETNVEMKEWFEAELEVFLTRDSDRKLFGLEPIPDPEEEVPEHEEEVEQIPAGPTSNGREGREGHEGHEGDLDPIDEPESGVELFKLCWRPISTQELALLRHDMRLDNPLASPAGIEREVQKVLDLRKRLIQDLEISYKEPPRQGRNEPCACGSGLKHKKCCLSSS